MHESPPTSGHHLERKWWESVQIAVLGEELTARNDEIPQFQMRIALTATVENEEDDGCDAVSHFEAVHVHELAVRSGASHGLILDVSRAKVARDGRVDTATLQPLQPAVEAVGTYVVRLQVDGRIAAVRRVEES